VSRKDQTCIVVGGGLAGLVAATILQREGVRVTVLDKGRGIGGRLATRRIQDNTLGEGVFDYGAQFFTARDPRFRSWVNQWLEVGVAAQWSPGFLAEDGSLHGVGEPRYRGVKGIRGIAKYLAVDLDVHTGTRVVKISWDCGRWSAHTEAESIFRGDILVLTPPVPQSLTLIHTSEIALPPAVKDRLHAVTYEACLAVLAFLLGPSQIPEPGGMWLAGDPIAWIADNQQKGISPRGVAVTIHAGAGFSQTQWETDDDAVAGQLLAAAARWLGTEVAQYQVHRWRYSKPATFYGESCLFLNEPGPWVLAGDGLVAPRIEGAFLSGLSAADAILSWSGI
jgi:predicted NAD/FAD-dependent oxidoreductase